MSLAPVSPWPTRNSTRELFRLAWPLILGSSIWTLQIVFDRVLLSRSDTESIGASQVGAVWFYTLLVFFQYTANYATVFVAQYTGANQPQRVGPVIGQALWFSLAAGLLILTLIPLAKPLAALGGHSPRVQELEATYLTILALAALPTLVNAAACGFFTGRGDSRTVMAINVSGLSVNVVAAALLIFGLWGFPKLGIAGAGWATVLGSSTSAVLSLILLLRPGYRASHGTGNLWRFEPELFFRLLKFGLPNGLFSFLDMLSFSMFISAVGTLGDVELAATSVTFTLNLVAFLPMLGVGQAVEVLVGQKLGENRPDEAARYTWTGLMVTLGFTAIIAGVYLGLPETLARVFTNPEQIDTRDAVIARVPVLLRFMMVYCLFDCGNLVFSFALRGAGDTRFVMILGVSLGWLVMVIPSLLVVQFGWGLYWAWGCASVYIILMALVFLVRFLQGRWRTMRVIETPLPDLSLLETDAEEELSESRTEGVRA